MERIGQETDIGQGFPFSVAITTLSGVPPPAHPPSGLLLCRSAHQALKGAPWVDSDSVAQWQAFDGQALCCSAAADGMWGERGYGDGSTPFM